MSASEAQSAFDIKSSIPKHSSIGCSSTSVSRQLSREISARRELQSHPCNLSASLLATSLSSSFIAPDPGLHSSPESSLSLTPRLTTAPQDIFPAELPTPPPSSPAHPNLELELSALSTPEEAPALHSTQHHHNPTSPSPTIPRKNPLWSPDCLGLGQLPASLSELAYFSDLPASFSDLSLASGVLLEDGYHAPHRLSRCAQDAHCNNDPSIINNTLFSATSPPAGGDDDQRRCASAPVPPIHSSTCDDKHTLLQTSQVPWGFREHSECGSTGSSPCERMSSSLCSYPLTLAAQDEEACALDADPVWSCACTLSSIGARSPLASSYAPVEFQQQQPPIRVPALRLALETAVVPSITDVRNASDFCSGYAQQPKQHQELCATSGSGKKGCSPHLSAELLKRMAQSPRSDIAALCAAAADGDLERVRKLIARGVPHTPAPSTQHSPPHIVAASDIDAASTPLMLAASHATSSHVECVGCLLAAGALADWALPNGRTALFSAAESGCLSTVQLLLSEGADASRNCMWGLTPFLVACRAFGALQGESTEACEETCSQGCNSLVDYFGVVQEFLSTGADVTATCHDGCTALEYVACNPDTRIAARLLSVLERTDACGCVERALSVAIQCCNYEAVKKLAVFPDLSLNAGTYCEPALLVAAATGDVQVLQLLLAAGATVDCTGHRQQTALHVSAAYDEEGCSIAVLLCARALLNARDMDGCTPLMCAAAAGNATTAVELLQMGAHVDVRNHQGLSALHIACMGSQTNVASALLAAGASPDLYTSDGARRTPLFAAAVCGSVSTVSLLLAAGAMVDSKDSHDANPLLHACEQATPESDGHIIELLLAAGADVGCCNVQGYTPLIAACQAGFKRGVRALLVHGGVMALHFRTADGTTPLIAAAESGRAGVVTMLLRAGAPAEYQRRADGMSAMMAAAAGGHDTCVQALVASGVHVTDRACLCMTALHFAAQTGNCSVVQRLVKAGAAVDARNARGATALMLAAEAGFCAVVGELLHSGADPELTDCYGCSAVTIATQKGNRAVLRKLWSAVKAAAAAAECMRELSRESVGRHRMHDSDEFERQLSSRQSTDSFQVDMIEYSFGSVFS